MGTVEFMFAQLDIDCAFFPGLKHTKSYAFEMYCSNKRSDIPVTIIPVEEYACPRIY